MMKRIIALSLGMILIFGFFVAGTAKKPDKPPGKPGATTNAGILIFNDDEKYLWRSDEWSPPEYIHEIDNVKMIINGYGGGIQLGTGVAFNPEEHSPRSVYLDFWAWDPETDNNGQMEKGELGAWFTYSENNQNWIPMYTSSGTDNRPEWLPSGNYDLDELQLSPENVPYTGKGKNPRARGTMEDMPYGEPFHCRFGCFVRDSATGETVVWMSHYPEDWFHTTMDLTMTRYWDETSQEDYWIVENTGYIDVYYDSIEHAVYMPFQFKVMKNT